MRSLRSVFEVPLANSSISEASNPFVITFNFTVVDGTPGNTANVEERQAVEAVAEATEAINALSTPATVGLLSSAVDAEPQVVSAVQTIDHVCGGLLNRIENFNKIVAGIAQVFSSSLSRRRMISW
jgi:hypothetical protein